MNKKFIKTYKFIYLPSSIFMIACLNLWSFSAGVLLEDTVEITAFDIVSKFSFYSSKFRKRSLFISRWFNTYSCHLFAVLEIKFV